MPPPEHPLAAILRDAAAGRWPADDGGWSHLPGWYAGVGSIVALTGHAFVCSDRQLDRDRLDALGCNGFGGATLPQVVLAVAEAQLDQLRATLQDNNLIYEVLRFDRAYHTPLFGPYAEVLRDVLQGWIVAPPEQPLYSCTTVGLFPDDLARCREIAHEHWIAPVEFRRTIEKMHDDGVRLFVEVGPRGNMSAFIGDVLRGREQMIIPSNLHHRSGLVQLHHLLAMLAAQAVPLSLDALYSRRAPRIVDFTSPANPYGDNKKQMGTMKLATGWPPIELSEDTIMSLRASAKIFSVASSLSTAIFRAGCGKALASMKANTNQGCITSVRRIWVSISQSRCRLGSALTSAGAWPRTSVAVTPTSVRIIDSNVVLLSK